MVLTDRHLVLVSGPPGCGKDLFSGMLAERLPAARVDKVAARLKELTHRFFGIESFHGSFEGVKGHTNDRFWGLSPREAYTAFSEQLIKPLFGKTYLGRYLLAKFWFDSSSKVFIVSDAGFADECGVLITYFGANRTTLVRVSRAGCTFHGDSRSSWDPPAGVHVVEVQNDSTIDHLEAVADKFASAWKERAIRTGGAV